MNQVIGFTTGLMLVMGLASQSAVAGWRETELERTGDRSMQLVLNGPNASKMYLFLLDPSYVPGPGKPYPRKFPHQVSRMGWRCFWNGGNPACVTELRDGVVTLPVDGDEPSVVPGRLGWGRIGDP